MNRIICIMAKKPQSPSISTENTPLFVLCRVATAILLGMETAVRKPMLLRICRAIPMTFDNILMSPQLLQQLYCCNPLDPGSDTALVGLNGAFRSRHWSLGDPV